MPRQRHRIILARSGSVGMHERTVHRLRKVAAGRRDAGTPRLRWLLIPLPVLADVIRTESTGAHFAAISPGRSTCRTLRVVYQDKHKGGERRC